MKFRCHIYWAASLLSPKQADECCLCSLFSRLPLTNFKTHNSTSKKQLFANLYHLPEVLCSWQHFSSPALDHLPGKFFLATFSLVTQNQLFQCWVPTSLLRFNCLHQGIFRKTLPQLRYVRSLRWQQLVAPPVKPCMSTETASCIAFTLSFVWTLFRPSFYLLLKYTSTSVEWLASLVADKTV